ncbi:MAG: sugar transferase [Hyphomicrobiales bacterium]
MKFGGYLSSEQMKPSSHSFYVNHIKRAIDLFAAIVTIPLWGGVCLLLCLLIKINMGGPVLFRQDRGGYRCEKFKLFKFRTMTQQKDENGDLLPDDQRITPLGRFIRSSSLDELPSLLNVILGDMSLIGPRPFIYDYMDYYTEEQKARHNLRPGVTGWAQINGRNTITWEQKFEYDLWYVENVSFGLDISIILKTFKKVLFRSNVNSNQDETMPRFDAGKIKRNSDNQS